MSLTGFKKRKQLPIGLRIVEIQTALEVDLVEYTGHRVLANGNESRSIMILTPDQICEEG